MNREKLAKDIEAVGIAVNNLRVKLIGANCVFLAGVVRGAEESIMLAKTTVEDVSVPEDEL